MNGANMVPRVCTYNRRKKAKKADGVHNPRDQRTNPLESYPGEKAADDKREKDMGNWAIWAIGNDM